MEITFQPMGDYQTNCYILTKNGKSLIIDPGVDAIEFCKANAKDPLAILNTHGHFDHVWSNDEVSKHFNIPIYCPKDDAIMLESPAPYGLPMPNSKADVLIENEDTIKLGDFSFNYFHAPGHTPGCSAIIFEDAIFSGDFIFQNSIGRVDFPMSNPNDMKKSIERFLEKFQKDMPIYSGHGPATSVQAAHRFLPMWLNSI